MSSEKKSILFLLIIFFCFKTNQAQIVPFYPVEIFFCPAGRTNMIPGNDITLYSTFSSLKVILNKDLPAMPKFSNTIALVANLIKYHDLNFARDYHPFSLAPTLTTHFFATDIFTLGLDLLGNYEYLPGFKKKPVPPPNADTAGTEVFNYMNTRFRIRPFHYAIISPNIILQQVFTYGRSYNNEKVLKNGKKGPVYVKNDYSIIRYDLKAIYLTKFNTRMFLIPYYFKTQYFDIAVDENGVIDTTLAKLRETGFGFTFGMRYMTFTWGYAEGAFEIERNFDLAYGGNDYLKLKVNAKWENQYFTERFGYLLMFDFIRHIAQNPISDFKTNTDKLDNNLGQYEIRGDIMPIFNLNRNISIRPEFDLVYRNYRGDRKNSIKYRYWLHLHILL